MRTGKEYGGDMSWQIFQLRAEGERGAVAVLFALTITVLLGCAAFAIDLGRLSYEKGQLQTGADAAALAVARDCLTKGTPACTLTAPATAQSYANLNQTSGLAGIKPPVFPAPGSVKITTFAKNSGGDGVEMTFAKFLGINNVQVSATATAAWGGPSAGVIVLPFVISECRFNLSGAIQVIQLDSGPSCTSSNGTGQTVPGGFGWLDPDPGKCSLFVTLAKATISSSPGIGTATLCKLVFEAQQNKTVLLPIYDSVAGSGTSGTYHIKGFAAFELLGYNLTGLPGWNDTGTLPGYPICTGSCKGLIGKFVRSVILEASWTGGGPDMGAGRLRLTQ